MNNDDVADMYKVTDTDYKITETMEVLLTAENGEKLSRQDNMAFRKGYAHGKLIVVRPDIVKQTIVGISGKLAYFFGWLMSICLSRRT